MKTLNWFSKKANILLVALWACVALALPTITVGVTATISMFLSGCATDIVGKAEQTTHIAAINFDTFLKFERENQAQLLAINPAIHNLAQKIRHKECATCDPNGIRWLLSARTFTETYRMNRSPENKFQMETAVALISTLLDQITQYFLMPEVAALNPPVTLSKKR